jgi:uncharacterized protein (DUF2252 family)
MTQASPSPADGAVDHPTASERAAHGKAARAAVPRSTHADWEPAPERPDPVDVLEEQARTRIPELVAVRYARMLQSPSTFFRGAAALMAFDLAALPRTGLRTQLSGDAHLGNFGVFATPDRRLVFSVNDFDETLPGPFEWDVKRLAASFVVAGRERGFDERVRTTIVRAAARSYREAMGHFAGLGTLDVWYARDELDEIVRRWSGHLGAKQMRQLEDIRPKDNLRALAKLTERVDGRPRLVSDPPLMIRLEELVGSDENVRFTEALREIVRSYRRTLPNDRRRLLERFRYVDAARKVVGVGSVGLHAYVLLLLGRDEGDPLFLQLKEAQASVLEPFLQRSEFANHGQRVVEGQRLTQAATDVMLGWLRVDDIDGSGERDYYVRQLWDGKAHVPLETMDAATLQVYAEVCGWTLAGAHARSGDAIAIGAYLGSGDAFDTALARFAERYADQNDRDYAAVKTAAASGRIPVDTATDAPR